MKWSKPPILGPKVVQNFLWTLPNCTRVRFLGCPCRSLVEISPPYPIYHRCYQHFILLTWRCPGVCLNKRTTAEYGKVV